MKKDIKSRGFTLVELSIVIVLIGLIVSGIIGAQSLMVQAKLQKQIAKFKNYEVAYNAFKLTYDGIPGDFNSANAYWGVLDGDGNGRITHDGQGASNVNRENLKFFLHLSQAGLIDGTYNNTWSLGTGFPATELADGKGMIAAGRITDSHLGWAPQFTSLGGLRRYKAALLLNVTNLPNAAYTEDYGVTSRKLAEAIDNKIDGGDDKDGSGTHTVTGKFGFYSVRRSDVGSCLKANEADACQLIYILAK